MTQAQWIILAFKVADIASVVTIAAFIGVYTRYAKWWRNPIGRTIVIKDVALILVLIPSILSIFFQFNRSPAISRHGSTCAPSAPSR